MSLAIFIIDISAWIGLDWLICINMAGDPLPVIMVITLTQGISEARFTLPVAWCDVYATFLTYYIGLFLLNMV